MAIRSLRKKMKPVIWMITIGFFISMLTVIVSNISMGLKNKRYAFKVNGEKIAITELERGINNITNQYSQYFTIPMDREESKILAVDNILTNEILKEIGDDLKVKVSSSEIKVKISAIETQIPDKAQFKRMLSAQGYTKKSFELSIKDSILIEKTRDKIIEKTKITENEKVTQYEKDKYREYLGKTYEEAKLLVEKKLKEVNGNKELIRLIETAKKAAEVDDIRENYGNITPTIEFEEDGFKITNIDVIKGALYQSFYGVKDYNEAKVKSIANIKDEIKLAKVALDRGAKKDETLPAMNQIMDLKLQLVDNIKGNIVASDVEIKKFFNENKDNYNVEASADANIINFVVNPTDLDIEEAKERATKVLKEVDASNFSEMAKKYSEGPSAPNGGDLGWFGKGQMIPEFETAAFKCEVGSVYPEVVKSKFGYHIIFVENKNEGKGEVKASHILIKVTSGEETFKKVTETAKTVSEELKTNKIKFEDASKKSYSKHKVSEYLDIKKDGYIKLLGYDDLLAKKIFESNLDEISVIKTEKGIYVFQKTKEIKFEKANFGKVKDRVIYDYKNQKLMEEMKKL
ncbi:MAG: peptidylprolyl isomerase [Psychrilyobacter sp.]|uniref:peptidylprolyl isomerase n=1 Tax=Psychrilyobacter sp. TaxID=2586924 RepID=UPI003C71C44D